MGLTPLSALEAFIPGAVHWQSAVEHWIQSAQVDCSCAAEHAACLLVLQLVPASTSSPTSVTLVPIALLRLMHAHFLLYGRRHTALLALLHCLPCLLHWHVLY